MGATVLLIDDAPMVSEAVRYVLVNAGYRVVEACDLQHALAALAAEPVHAAIVDMQLASESGVALLRRIREAIPGVKRILMSGAFEEGEPPPKQLEGVADAILPKPIDSDELRETLFRLLKQAP